MVIKAVALRERGSRGYARGWVVMVDKIRVSWCSWVLLVSLVVLPLGALGCWIWELSTRPPANPPATIYYHYDEAGKYTGKTVLGK